MRSLPLAAGTTFEMPINEAGRNMKATIAIGAPETVDAAGGPQPAFRVEPRLTTRVQRRQGIDATIWIRCHARRPARRRHHRRIRPRAIEASRLSSVIETLGVTKA